MVKATFTLDDDTADKLNLTARRLAKPKSEVVREAINQFYRSSDRLSDEERDRMLRALREFAAQPPTRPQHEVEKELRELRRARRSRGRLHPVD